MRIVLTGGGTGGHLVPFEPIIEALRTLHQEEKNILPARLDPNGLSLTFLGVADVNTILFFKNYDVPAINIPSGKLRRYMSHLTILDLFLRLPIGLMKAMWHMWRIMPDVVISKGGYGSFPVVVAAWFYRIPVLLHESDATAGLSNKWLARLATTIAVGFSDTLASLGKWKDKATVTGIPVRSSFLQQDPIEAKKVFGFDAADQVLLVMGGSQGARQINEALLKILPQLVMSTAIIHITGEKNFQEVSKMAEQLIASSSRHDKYKAFPYLTDKIDEAYTAADVVVSRAGATTLAELSHLRKSCLLIPLEGAASDHQRLNAVIYERAGAALVLDPANLTANILKSNLEELLNDPKVRENLAYNIGQLDRPQAAADLAKLAFTLASGLAPVYNQNPAK